MASTARPLRGTAWVTRHHRPHVGFTCPVGTGKSALRTSSRAAPTTPAARRPVTASPTRPAQLTTATASPSQPAQPVKAPKIAKTTVAATSQTMFWMGSSPTSQPTKKLGTLSGSRRNGRYASSTPMAPTTVTAR